MSVKKKVIYLNVAEAVQDKDGYLPAKAATDGIHMNKEYCDKWMYYIRTHTDVPIAGETTPTKTADTSVGPASTSYTSATQTSIAANTTATTAQK